MARGRRRTRWGSAAAVLVATLAGSVALIPAEAEACSCFPQVSVGQSSDIAANGRLLFADFCGGSLSDVVATVDGEEASLVRAPATANPYFAEFDPPLEVGQEVEIRFGSPEFPLDSDLTVLSVTEPDTTAPVLSEPTMELLDPPEPSEDDFCGGSTPVAVARLSVSVDALEEEGVLYRFVVAGDGEFLLDTTSAVFPPNDVAQVTISDLILEPIDEICVEVTAVDAAGNASEPTSNCIEGPSAVESDAGCACTADGEGSQGWAALLFAGLLGAASRRRRRRIG